MNSTCLTSHQKKKQTTEDSFFFFSCVHLEREGEEGEEGRNTAPSSPSECIHACQRAHALHRALTAKAGLILHLFITSGKCPLGHLSNWWTLLLVTPGDLTAGVLGTLLLVTPGILLLSIGRCMHRWGAERRPLFHMLRPGIGCCQGLEAGCCAPLPFIDPIT